MIREQKTSASDQQFSSGHEEMIRELQNDLPHEVVSDEEAAQRFVDADDKQRFQHLKKLADQHPSDRLATIRSSLEIEGGTRIKKKAMEVMRRTAMELPEESLPILTEGVHDPNDNVCKSAVLALAGLVRSHPHEVVGLLEYALTRRQSVRAAVVFATRFLVHTDPDSARRLLYEAQDKRGDPYVANKYGTLIFAAETNPDLFDLKGTSETDMGEAASDALPSWREMLAQEMKDETYGRSISRSVRKLEKREPGLGLGLLRLQVEAYEARTPEQRQRSRESRWERELDLSSITYFLIEARNEWADDEEWKEIVDKIYADPFLSNRIDQDLAAMGESGPLSFEQKEVIEDSSELLARFDKMYPTKWQRVSTKSAEYKQHRESLNHFEPEREIFGTNLLRAVGRHGGLEPAMKQGYFLSTLQHSRQEIDGYIKSGKLTFTQQRVIFNELTALSLHDSIHVFREHGFATISDENFILWLHHHQDIEQQKMDESAESLPVWEARFRQRAIELGVDEELVDQRIAETHITFFDDITGIGRDREDFILGGDYRDDRAVARIRRNDDVESLETIYVHEMFHALSGRSPRRRQATPRRLEDNENQKIGLRFQATHDRYNLDRKVKRLVLNWLNEAVTEDLTRDAMYRTQENSVYRSERGLLHLLVKSGRHNVDMQLFRDAYFENYDPDAEAGQKMKHWHTLQKALADAYGENILVTLDKIIEEKDIYEATAYLEARSLVISHKRGTGALDRLFKSR